VGTFNSPFQAPSKLFGPLRGITGFDIFSPFVATSASIVGNTTTETTLLSIPGAFGSKTIPAGYLDVGSTIKVYITGSIGTDAVVPSITLNVYHGNTLLSTSVATPATQLTAAYFEYTSTSTVRTVGASGALITGQIMWIKSLTALGPSAIPASATVDTTKAGAVDVRIIWGTANANNTISAVTGYIEVIG